MELIAGYKHTELGVIPDDWICCEFGDAMIGFSSGQTPSRAVAHYYGGSIPWVTSGELNYNFIDDTIEKITKEAQINTHLKLLPIGTFLIAITGLEAEGTRGSCAITAIEATTNQSCMALYPIEGKLTTDYMFFYYSKFGKQLAFMYCQGTKQQSYTAKTARKLPFIYPPNLAEQQAIATALSDTDALISTLTTLIEKKKAVKRATMQALLTPKEGWVERCLGDLVDILDHLRVPLNEHQRSKMKGDIPYCGANGIVGYVNDYVIDDDIILIAEDGGYFDEYSHRPIAFKMNGKSWVNNHAHILKAKTGVFQDFIFYSLVHKNILDFITGGTRAKLNKGALVNIGLWLPTEIDIQAQIANCLTTIDDEIVALSQKLTKLKNFKQAQMQVLLTGKIRLV